VRFPELYRLWLELEARAGDDSSRLSTAFTGQGSLAGAAAGKGD